MGIGGETPPLLLNPPLWHGYLWSTKGHRLQGTAMSIDARTEALMDNFECWKFEIYLLSLWKYGVGKILIPAISYRWLVVVYANGVIYWISRNSPRADTAFCKVIRMTYSNFSMSSGWPYVIQMRYHQERSHLDDTRITTLEICRLFIRSRSRPSTSIYDTTVAVSHPDELRQIHFDTFTSH